MNEYTISGMHCEACATLIQMELEDAGLSDVIVNKDQKTLSVPVDKTDRLEEIQAALAKAGSYTLSIL